MVKIKDQERTQQSSTSPLGTPRFRCALWSLLPASTWSKRSQEIESGGIE